MPPLRGFLENTLLDWEGKIAAMVFLPGCNFRCGYCHARHLLEPDLSDETIPPEAVLQSLRRNRGWVDGVVISGGEPTLHPDLPELIDLFRAEGLGVKLDTNGSRPDTLERLLSKGLLDYVAMDVKAPLDDAYREVAGAPVDVEAIRRSIELLLEGSVPYEFRTTVCPAQLGAGQIERIARAIRGAERYYLQPFRPVNCYDRSFETIRPYNGDEMRELCRAAAPFVARCAVRGDSAATPAAAGSRESP